MRLRGRNDSMTNIIEFKAKKKSTEHDPFNGLSEEEYAVTLLRVHRMEKKIQNALFEKTMEVNEPDDLRDVLVRMEIFYDQLNGTFPETPCLTPIQPQKLSMLEKLKNLFT